MISRPLTVVFAALEALLVVGVGIAIPLVPLSVLWAAHFGFGPDWGSFWRASVDAWLIGHGVDVTFVLDPGLSAALGLPGADQPVTVTIAVLGFAFLTVLLAVRAGRRVAETRYRVLGALVSVGVFAAASVGLTATALHAAARPSLVQAALLPTLFFAAGLLVGIQLTRRDLGVRSARMPWDALPPTARDLALAALRGGAAMVAMLMVFASIVTAFAIVVAYARIITLYESLHTEWLGGIAVTLGQLLLLPTVVVWVASWLVGPGFAIGTGSLVSPLGTTLGPIPAIPLFGAIPEGSSFWGFLGLLAPVVAAFLVGAVLGPGLRRRFDGTLLIVAAAGMAIVGGILLGVLAGFASGSAGPGRLIDVGPDPWAVGGWATVQFAIAGTVGVLASARRRR